MPVDRGGDAPIAPPPVGVHSGDNSMITILEAGIYRVDLIRRDQGLIEQIAALLGAEVGRIGRCYFGDHAQRAGNRFQQISGHGNTVIPCPLNLNVRQRYQITRILTVAVEHDQRQHGQYQDHEQHRNAELESDLFPLERAQDRSDYRHSI